MQFIASLDNSDETNPLHRDVSRLPNTAWQLCEASILFIVIILFMFAKTHFNDAIMDDSTTHEFSDIFENEVNTTEIFNWPKC